MKIEERILLMEQGNEEAFAEELLEIKNHPEFRFSRVHDDTIWQRVDRAISIADKLRLKDWAFKFRSVI